MFEEPFSPVQVIKSIVQDVIAKMNTGVSIWLVTDIQSKGADGYITQYQCQIKHLNFKYTLDNVPIAGVGLGNNKGILKYPSIGDFVLVAFQDKNPFIIGTIPDYFSQKPDNIPLIREDELIIVPKEKGSIVLFQQNNDLIIRIADENGDVSRGSRVKLSHDGSLKLFNKDNYGIEVDASGNMTLRGVTINSTQTPGVF